MLPRNRLVMAAALAVVVGLAVPSIAVAADRRPPSTPTGLKATSVTPTSISITWNASTDNVGVVGYRVFRNGTFTDAPSGLSSTLWGLTCGTTYIVMVSAKDAAGNKSLPATRLLSTAACPPAAPACPSPATVLALLLEHKITYGCGWPEGWAARQAVQSIRGYLSTRAVKLETWRGRRWHKEALAELDAATSTSGAWYASGALQPNKYGASALQRLHRVIRIMQYHNDEFFEVSKTEKWAITATVWYIVASEYNRHYKAGHTNVYDMKAALSAIQRGDADFFAANTYRAAGRYIKAFRRLNQLF